MKILINASTLVVGGGVQVAINLIKNTVKDTKNEYVYILSKEVASQLEESVKNEMRFYEFAISPASIFKGRKVRKEILNIEANFKPNIVYSVGAPSYVKFKSKEVLRLTNPWVIGASSLAYSSYPITESILKKIKVFVKRRYINNKHFIITQTEAAKKGIVKNLKLSENKIFVIPNVQASIFNNFKKDEKCNTNSDTLRIFCFAAPYYHKNISIIPEVILELKKLGNDNFKFITTIPNDVSNHETNKFFNQIKKNRLSGYVKNLGKVKFKDVPETFLNCDLLFLPTLLEVFSVTYLEAMNMGVPIVTTNLSFATEVCGDAALYFEPKNAKDAALRINELILEKKLRVNMVKNGQIRLKEFLTEDVIYRHHIDVLEQIIELN